MSFIEVAIAVGLLGTGVTAMLSALNITVLSSVTERDHANAHAWLQTAADTLYRYERIDCTDHTPAEVEAGYQSVVSAAEDPEGWSHGGGSIEIVGPVLYWDGERYQDVCYDDQNLNLQLVQIRVTNPRGEIVESVEVVKG